MKKKKKEIVVSITAVISLIVVCVELVTAIIHLDGKGGSGNTVINVQEGDGVNVIGDENIFRIEINTKKDDNVLSKITDSTQIYTQRIDNIDEQIWESEEDVLKCIKINYIIENYEKVIDLAEKYGLQDTEYMLNVFGVMYAQGIYFEQDYEKAIQYLTAATEYGNMENTFLNLWLVSYEKDKEEVEKTLFPYQNVYEADVVS